MITFKINNTSTSSSMVIPELDCFRKAFNNIHKLLKLGGMAFLTFFDKIPCDSMFDELSRHPKWSKYGQEDMISSYFYSSNPEEEYKKDLEAAGFKNYVFEVEKGSYNFSSEQECNGKYLFQFFVLHLINLWIF